jgi:hypothetical protein
MFSETKPTVGARAQECCDWCRQPIHRCRASACDDTRVYLGLPSASGAWVPVDRAADRTPNPMLPRSSSVEDRVRARS